MTMTKRELANQVAEEQGLLQDKALEIVQKTLDVITRALGKGQKVELRKFGAFDIKVRKARIGRNPKKPGTDVAIPARAIVKFKPGNEMRDAVARLSPTRPAAGETTVKRKT